MSFGFINFDYAQSHHIVRCIILKGKVVKVRFHTVYIRTIKQNYVCLDCIGIANYMAIRMQYVILPFYR